jgi:hypothetical protein
MPDDAGPAAPPLPPYPPYAPFPPYPPYPPYPPVMIQVCPCRCGSDAPSGVGPQGSLATTPTGTATPTGVAPTGAAGRGGGGPGYVNPFDPFGTIISALFG